jgi:hypothetical protein
MVKRQELDLKNKDFCDEFRSVDDVAELTVANDWHPWWQEGGVPEEVRDANEAGYLWRPEYKPESARDFGYKRVRTGDFAQKFFSTFATHNAGLYQQVTGVPEGKRITFSCWVQVWSSQRENIDVSQENGRYKTGVGVDPYGGTDPMSPNVVWGELVEEYDEWGQRTVSVESMSDTVTVFLRGTCQWRVKHNDSYWDEARLYAEPLLKSGSDYLLLPEDAGVEWYRAAAPFLATFGISAGQSWNDAGLLGGTVVVVNPTEEQLSNLEDLEIGVEIIQAATWQEFSAALAERIEDGHHLELQPPSERDYVLMPAGAGSQWYTALMPYLMHFGPSSGRSVEVALRHRGFVTAINPSPEVLAELQADADIDLDVIEAESPEVLHDILQKRIDMGRRVK